MIDPTSLLRQVQAFLLEEISGADVAEPFADVERARLCSMIIGATPAAVDAAFTSIGSSLSALSRELTHGQRQSVIREICRSFDGDIDDRPPDQPASN